MKYFDEHPDVLRWSSEETIIPYYDPVTQKWRRYFVDFQITCRTRAGEIVTYLVEVKPADQCVPPVPPKRKTAKSCANFENKINTYMTNSAKWQATEKVCEQKGWKFIKLTEQHLRYQK